MRDSVSLQHKVGFLCLKPHHDVLIHCGVPVAKETCHLRSTGRSWVSYSTLRWDDWRPFMWKLSCTGVMLQSSVGPRLLVCATMSRKDLFLQERGEGSLNTSSSGLATGMKADGTMAYQADAEGEGSGSDPAGT